jgi:hypothetical protein
MSEINSTLNDVFKSTSLGDVKSSIGATLYGFNHRATPLPVSVNKDNHGYVFFTRPQLNFTNANLRSLRRFVPLMDQNALSLPRVIRRYLDPRLDPATYPCPVVDGKQAFIPLLSNHLLSCAGWPDPALDTFTSRPGAYREVYSLVDSVIDNFASYDLNCTFRNMQGDPITALIDHWMWYKSKVFTGELSPYPDFIALNEVDYQTRVYRLVMDKNKQYVQKIACCGVSVPVANPSGNAYNFESDRPLNQLNDQIQVRFQATGFCYQDPILVQEFNATVAIFNPDLGSLFADPGMTQTWVPMKKRVALDHVLLKPDELQMFNNTGYPLIDPDTNELLWYVNRQEYQARMSGFTRAARATGLIV